MAMKRKHGVRIGPFITVMLIGLGGSGTALGGQLAAKKNGVKVFAEPKKEASVVAELKEGDTIESGNREGMYWSVQVAGGQKGFVSVMDVKNASGNGNLNQALRAAVKEGRQTEDGAAGARARSSVMGVRGLDETDDTAKAGDVRPNLRLVYEMEDRRVKSKDLEKLETSVQSEIQKKIGK